MGSIAVRRYDLATIASWPNGFSTGREPRLEVFATAAPAWRHLGDTMDRPDRIVRPYRAMIWTRDPNRPGQRVSVLAENLKEARERLEAEYGEGNVFNLHNEDDAARPR
jgi:hypothetical protein